MLLSKSCLYGIRAALYLATQDTNRYVPIMEISERLKISFHFLTKILQTLTEKKLLHSYRGPNGGIALAKPGEQVTLLDIIDSIDGLEVFNGCILGLPGCGEQRPCPLHDKWAAQRAATKQIFATTTVGELAARVEQYDLRLTEVDLIEQVNTPNGSAPQVKDSYKQWQC